jgi:hypothetical protein
VRRNGSEGRVLRDRERRDDRIPRCVDAAPAARFEDSREQLLILLEEGSELLRLELASEAHHSAPLGHDDGRFARQRPSVLVP